MASSSMHSLSVSVITPWRICYLWDPWGSTFKLFLHISGKYVFSPQLVLLFMSDFLVEHVTGQFRLLIPWLPTVLSMMENITHQCLIVKDLIWYTAVGWVLKGLPLLHLILLLLSDVCCSDKGSLPQAVRWWWG